MKAIVTIIDDNDNIVEKDKVVFPYKSDTRIEGEGDNRLRIDEHEFRLFFCTMKPFKGRCLI